MNTDKQFTCPICLKNPKEKGHLMCPNCMTGKDGYNDYVVSMLVSQKEPETKFAYAKRKTQENLFYCQQKLAEVQTYHNVAYEQISKGCRKIHTKLDRAQFISAINVRLAQILKASGLQYTVESINKLRKDVGILRQQMDWFVRIEQEKKAKAEEKEDNVVPKKESA